MQARQAALGRQGVGRMPRSGHQQTWRPNKPLELTPLRVERDRADFEGRFPLEGFPNLQGGAAQRQAVGPRYVMIVPIALHSPNTTHLHCSPLLTAHVSYGRVALDNVSYEERTMFDPTTIADDVVSRVSEHYQRANAEQDRAIADDQTIGELIERFQHLLDLLFLPATGRYAYRIPATFWSEPGIGQVLARVQAWLRHDDLIPLTEAAQLLFPDVARTNLQAARMRVKRLTERGELMVYLAPDEPNPTQQVRVSRQAIEALHAAGYAQKQ